MDYNQLKAAIADELWPLKQDIESMDHDFVQESKKNRLYQSIYFGFGVLFFFLGAFVVFKTQNWDSSLYFQRYELVKQFTYVFCFLLSLGAFGLSFASNPEMEVTDNIIETFKKKLERLYNEMKLKHPHYPHFRQFYLETKEKIERKREKTVQRLRLIKQASLLDFQSREKLCYEIYLDLNTKLKSTLHFFIETIDQVDSGRQNLMLRSS